MYISVWLSSASVSPVCLYSFEIKCTLNSGNWKPFINDDKCFSFHLKEDLGPKTHPCFYVIMSMILWKKSLVPSFVLFWSVLTKLLSYKVLVWVTSYPRMYKTFYPWFSLHIFVSFTEKEQFYCRFDHFSLTYKVAKFWIIKLCLEVSEVIHANEHT